MARKLHLPGATCWLKPSLILANCIIRGLHRSGAGVPITVDPWYIAPCSTAPVRQYNAVVWYASDASNAAHVPIRADDLILWCDALLQLDRKDIHAATQLNVLRLLRGYSIPESECDLFFRSILATVRDVPL